MVNRVSQANLQALSFSSPDARVSQVNIQGLGYVSPNAHVSQVNLQVLWFPLKTVYCWARQKNHPQTFAVTPVQVGDS